MNNGRVQIDIDDKNMYKMYNLHEDPINNNNFFTEESIKGIQEKNKTNIIFFSQKNIDALQEGIRYKVYVQSNKKFIIDKQSEDELKIIMRSVYLQHAYFDDENYLKEIKYLNGIILDFCVPRILREINQYMLYTNDIKNLPKPMEYGKFSTNKGTKVLELKNFM